MFDAEDRECMRNFTKSLVVIAVFGSMAMVVFGSLVGLGIAAESRVAALLSSPQARQAALSNCLT